MLKEVWGSSTQAGGDLNFWLVEALWSSQITTGALDGWGKGPPPAVWVHRTHSTPPQPRTLHMSSTGSSVASGVH